MVHHGIVRTDKMSQTDARNGLVSVLVSESNGLDNGCVAVLGGLVSRNGRNMREVYGISPAENNSDFNSLVMLVSPEIDASMPMYALSWHYNKYGDVARGYRIRKGDIVSVTSDMLTGFSDDTTIGSVIELSSGAYKLKVSSEPSDNTTIVGYLGGIEEIDGYTFCEICIGDQYESGGSSRQCVVGTAIVGTDAI